MSRLKDRAHFYRTLATLEQAGVPRIKALRQRFPGIFHSTARQIETLIATHGLPLATAMRRFPRVFAPFECSLVDIGEQTGHMDTVLVALADWFDQVQRLKMQIISNLMYPALQYHLAMIIIPFINLFLGQSTLAGAVIQIGLYLGIPYAVAFFLLVVKPALYPEGLPLPLSFSRYLLTVPWLGRVLYLLDSTRFFRGLALSLQAGAGVAVSTRLSATACTNSFLRHRYLAIADQVQQQNCSFTTAFSSHQISHDRNASVSELLETGETTGRPDDMAARIARICGEELEEALKRAAKVIPMLIYFSLMLYIAFKIVRFYGAIFSQVQDLL